MADGNIRMQPPAMATDWEATLALLRWRTARRGHEADAKLLKTGTSLLCGEELTSLRAAAAKCNVPPDRIATEVIHFALHLVAKPSRDDADKRQSRKVLTLLHLGLKALRATAGETGNLAIPLNSCNLLLAAMADTLESVAESAENAVGAIVDVQQIFVFLFAMATSDTPSFTMYKPPTNVFSAFMQRACSAAFAQLEGSPAQRELVALVRGIVRVFQELQFSQVNKKKVFVAIAKTSFREVVGYRHALLSHCAIDGVGEILRILDRIIVDALFDSEHLREFEGALVNIRLWQETENDEGTHHKHKKQKQKPGASNKVDALVSYQRHLFDELKSFLSDATVPLEAKQSIGSLVEVLVNGFSVRIRAAANEKIEDTRSDLKSSKKRVANVIATTSTAYSPFKFWAELCGVAFGAFQAVQQEKGEHEAVAMLASVYDSLFKALCDADVYRVTEDTEEQEQFHMMQTILSRFVEFLLSDEYKAVVSATSAATTARVCSIISNAVRCTPNLVNTSLVSIFEVMGAYSGVQNAASDAMVELLHAYESMRLIDSFLRACCATSDENAEVSLGLQSIMTHATTEATLRRTYMTLPPGQLEIVWRLLTDKLATLCGSRESEKVAAKMALVRSFFAVFLQEIHITPQNRAKVGELVTESHDKLLATLSSRATRFQSKKGKKNGSDEFSIVERELFSVFGEFLALYDGLAPSVRAQTLDVVLSSLENKLSPIMRSLLAGQDHQTLGAAAGIIKIGVHKLRRNTTDAEVAKNVATLIVDRVIGWRCWNAVAFYLAELVQGIDDGKATAFYVELVRSYLGQDSQVGAAERILRDAAFYEIVVLQRVASQVFANVVRVKGFTDERRSVKRLFDYLAMIPTGYLRVDQDASGELLGTALDVHKTIANSQQPGDTDTLTSVAKWIERYLVATATVSENAQLQQNILAWTEFLLIEASTFDGSSTRLIRVAVTYLTSSSAGEAAHSALENVFTRLLAQKTTRGYETSATVLEAFASIQEKQPSETSTSKFVDLLILRVEADPSIVNGHDSETSFQLLTALLKYTATLPENASAPFLQVRRSKISALMATHVSSALSSAMQRITVDQSLTDSRHGFFGTFCEYFHLLRPTVTLETFGCLLAVALVLASTSAESDINNDRPLSCLVQHSNKDEFRLLISTLIRELLVPSSDRVIAALKALVFLLDTDKKLSPSWRQVLSEAKTCFVGTFIQIFSRTLTHSSTGQATSLCLWNLRVFVLFYCKAELFTWKSHELPQVFIGFQPLTAISAQLKSDVSSTVWSSVQIHQVWLLSYTLLLRIVRHHFASLINGIPHMIDALNALLRVLIATSTSASATNAGETTAYTLEWSSNLARLYGYLKPQDAALRKHVVYLLLTYLRGVTQGKLSLGAQQKLRSGVFALLEICSQFEKEQLYASLDSTGKSLLKSLDTSYKLTYRYAGKV